MEQINVFISVGETATPKYEVFVRAVEDRLRSEGLVPHTVGRNTFSADAPLKALTEVMDTCVGTVVIALERTYFPSGVDKRGGPKETVLSEIKLTTPWNQIEAAMAYSRGHPMMVIVEIGLRSEGLLERGFSWYVQQVLPEATSLNTVEFNGVLASWKSKLIQYSSTKMASEKESAKRSTSELTIGELIKNLKPAQLWSILTALVLLITGSFGFGAHTQSAHTVVPSPQDPKQTVANDFEIVASEKIANFLGNNQPEQARAYFNDFLNNNLSVDQIQQSWNQMVSLAGEFDHVVKSKSSVSADGLNVVDVLCATKKAGIRVSVTFDPVGLVGGLMIFPTARP